MLLSTQGKVLNRVLLERMKEATDPKLWDQQAGFWRNRSCADQIASLRIIVEQSLKRNSPLYISFTDCEKTFDSIDRETMWKLLRHYGIPKKIISFIRCTYQDMSFRIAHPGQMSESFKVKTGVRRGYLLSPFLFPLVIDWNMKTNTTGRNNGIQCTFWTQRDDLDFADDLALLSQSQPDAGQDHSPGDHISRGRAQDRQEKDRADEDVHNCQRTSHSWWRQHQRGGVFRVPGKRGWPTGRHRLRCHSQHWQGKSSFRHAQKYLGIWRNQHENQTLYLQLYGCETWRTTQTIQQKIQTFLQHLSEAHLQTPMAGEDPKWRSVGASGTGTSGQTDTAEEVGLDRTHPQEASIQH